MSPLAQLISLALLVVAALVGRREARLAALGKVTALGLYLGVDGLWAGPTSTGALAVAGAVGVYWALLVVRSGAPWLAVLLVSQGLQLMVQGAALIGLATASQALAAVGAALIVQVVAIASAATMEGSRRFRPRYVSLLGAGER
jgi:hypothetical protein